MKYVGNKLMRERSRTLLEHYTVKDKASVKYVGNKLMRERSRTLLEHYTVKDKASVKYVGNKLMRERVRHHWKLSWEIKIDMEGTITPGDPCCSSKENRANIPKLGCG